MKTGAMILSILWMGALVAGGYKGASALKAPQKALHYKTILQVPEISNRGEFATKGSVDDNKPITVSANGDKVAYQNKSGQIVVQNTYGNAIAEVIKAPGSYTYATWISERNLFVVTKEQGMYRVFTFDVLQHNLRSIRDFQSPVLRITDSPYTNDVYITTSSGIFRYDTNGDFYVFSETPYPRVLVSDTDMKIYLQDAKDRIYVQNEPYGDKKQIATNAFLLKKEKNTMVYMASNVLYKYSSGHSQPIKKLPAGTSTSHLYVDHQNNIFVFGAQTLTNETRQLTWKIPGNAHLVSTASGLILVNGSKMTVLAY